MTGSFSVSPTLALAAVVVPFAPAVAQEVPIASVSVSHDSAPDRNASAGSLRVVRFSSLKPESTFASTRTPPTPTPQGEY